MTGTAGGSGNNTFVRHLVDRHPGQTINVSFIDGHSESVSARGMYELQWSRMYDLDIGRTTGQTLNWP